MAEGTINVQDTAALAEESRGVLKDCEAMRECIGEIKDVEESLSSWESPQKEQAFASMNTMISKLESLLDMVTLVFNQQQQLKQLKKTLET